VVEARRKKRAKHEADVASDLAPWYASKDEKGLAQELMPALRPELV